MIKSMCGSASCEFPHVDCAMPSELLGNTAVVYWWTLGIIGQGEGVKTFSMYL